MGYDRHIAIVVSSQFGGIAERARQAAMECGLGDLCTPIVRGRINGIESFAIVPDGSRLGWQDTATVVAQRDAFIARLRSPEFEFEDGSAYVQYAEVRVYDEANRPSVTRSNFDRRNR